MRNQKWFILIFVVLCFSIWGLDAKKIVIYDNDLEKTIHCEGDVVEVYGNDNVLKIKGECSKLFVPGNENIIRVEAVALINAPGNENNITWKRGIDGSKPSISSLGIDNVIKKAGATGEEVVEKQEEHTSDDQGVTKQVGDALSKLEALKESVGVSTGTTKTSGKTIQITTNLQVKTLTLKGEKLIIIGNFNKLKVKGVCSVLQVTGNSNEVKIEAVGTINAIGNLNKIFWKKGLDDENPSVSNTGLNNTVSQE